MRADEIVSSCLNSAYPVLFVHTHEERRIYSLLEDIAQENDDAAGDGSKTIIFDWSLTTGVVSTSEQEVVDAAIDSGNTFLSEILGATGQTGKSGLSRSGEPDFLLKALSRHLRSENTKGGFRFIWVMRDYLHFMNSSIGYRICRLIKDVADLIAKRGAAHTVIIIDSEENIPPRLEKVVYKIQWEVPNREELTALVDRMGTATLVELEDENGKFTGDKDPLKETYSKDEWHDLVESVVNSGLGLTEFEMKNALGQSFFRTGTFDANYIINEKKAIIAKDGVLEYWPSDGGLGNVGGADHVKSFLRMRRNAFSEEAREYNLPMPKGVLLLGVPGTGKSLIAKCIGAEWGVPVLKMDMGRVMGGIVGQSEKQLRGALALAEAMSPCVLFIDELEKAIGGSGERDGGTSSRVKGTLLSWMNDKIEPVYVLATANKINNLPPELLRKGRLDEIFFLDIPSSAERLEILEVVIKRVGRNPKDYNLVEVVRNTDGFTGAELAEGVTSAMYRAFDDNQRPFNTQDLIDAVTSTKPLVETMSESIEDIRKWASDHAVPASSKKKLAYEEGGSDKPSTGNAMSGVRRNNRQRRGINRR
jgi:AAA+ superfamily predicted ATPase